MLKFRIFLIISIVLIVLAFFVGGLFQKKPESPPSENITTPRVVNPQGDTILFQNERYKIVYFPLSQRYLVSILSSPFSTIRPEAETAFLTLLRLSKTDACKLNVSVITPRWVNPNEATIEYPLSFCLEPSPTPDTTLNPKLYPLYATKISPAGGEIEYGNTTTGIFITFTQSVDRGTAVVEVAPETPVTVNVHPRDKNTLVIEPNKPWVIGSTYKITLKAGLLSNLGTFQLKEDVTVEYRIKPLPTPEFIPD